MPFGEEETVFQARWLEDLGYEYLAVGEHFMRGNPPVPTAASLPVLGVAAGATERIRLLPSVLLTPFYHPTVLAKLTASLDVASGGRLTLGVGVGGEFPVEFQAAELEIKERGSRTNECLDAMRRLWTQERVSFRGRHFSLEDVTISPRPAQKPHPPIWVGGRRQGAMLRAAHYGDGWYPYFYSPEQYRDSVARITQLAEKEGRDTSHFQWALMPFTAIYPTMEEAATVAAEAMGGRYHYFGDFTELARRYCILGPVENCVRRLREYVDAGVRYIVFAYACPVEDRTMLFETLSQEVIPALRG